MSLLKGRFELGYRFLNCLISEISDDPHLLLIITSILIYGLLFQFFIRYSSSPWLSILLFIFTTSFYNSMCLQRQYLAIAMGCVGIGYLIEKKWIRSVVFILLAFSFHASAIVLIVLLPLTRLNLDVKKRLILMGILLVAAISIDRILPVFLQLIGRYQGYLTGKNYYLQNKLGVFSRVFLYGLFFLIQVLTKSEEFKLQEKTEYYLGMLAFVGLIAAIDGAIISRVASYFCIFSCVSVPNAIQRIKKKNNRIITTVVLIIGVFAYSVVILVFRPNWAGVLPYVFWE